MSNVQKKLIPIDQKHKKCFVFFLSEKFHKMTVLPLQSMAKGCEWLSLALTPSNHSTVHYAPTAKGIENFKFSF